jgi:hypothetical protein
MNISLALVKLAATDRFSPAAFEEGSSGALQSLSGAAAAASRQATAPMRMGQPSASAGFTGGSQSGNGYVNVHLRPDQQAFYGGAAPAFKKMPYESEKQLQKAYGPQYEQYRQRISSSFGEKDPKRLTDIMNVMHGESGAKGNAARGDVGGQSRGLFQINQPVHPGYRHDPANWQTNVDYAGKLYRQSGLKPWKTTTLRKGIRFYYGRDPIYQRRVWRRRCAAGG